MNKIPSETSDLKHTRGAVSSVLLPGKPDSGGEPVLHLRYSPACLGR